jgi:hypothetical protein
LYIKIGSIDADFIIKNKDILQQRRGAGYWLWKPYILDKYINLIKPDDILIYTDAGVLFENNVSYLINAMDNDIMLFGNRWTHGDWCKMDVLMKMGCVKFRDHEQLQASCIIAKKSEFSISFFNEWLRYSQLPGYIDDSESNLPNLSNFREHRHDQAILTNLALLHNIPFHWWPVQYNLRYKDKYKDSYPIIFHHHRKRNPEW